MEPNKIEEQFRDKLNSREIQPSAQAWDRLDAMLSVAEEKKTRRPFGFLFIAASILVFVTAGLYFFTSNTTEIKPENNVVGTETKKNPEQNKANGPAVLQPKAIVAQKPESQVAVASENKAIINHQQSTINHKGVAINNQKTTTNQIIKNKEIVFQNSSDVALKELPKVSDAKEIKQPVQAPSDESLLADLDNTAKQSTNRKSTVKVDAKSLLLQVDGELELTFREKVISKVNKNYQEVKVALANRNKE